ncbi:Uncharacterized protein T01_3011 [Trichinella spiralis]|uniref:Synapse-associated protein of 47 kDa n=1 Tax=Trichinella spiralis TaxID=6334 RepID=A0A0V1B0X1_TRISP|nr:Uncharacterized protein T01_3011 [Trichinella spiralis]
MGENGSLDSYDLSNVNTGDPASNALFINNECQFTSSPASQPAHTVEYLAQLLKDKKQLVAFSHIFAHVERLVDEEINKVRASLFSVDSKREALALPEAVGPTVTLQEKVYVPVQEYPDFNFVGRILGPRGMTAKQLEQDSGCKIMVRGKGSMRDKKKEDQNRGKPNWEHLNDELHVLIQCEDTENRAKIKMKRAVEEVQKLLVPAPEGEDELKRKQLMELAIINGTYRPTNQSKNTLQLPRILNPLGLTSSLRTSTLGAPIILSPPRLGATGAPGQLASVSALLANSAAPDVSGASTGLLYNPVDPSLAAAAAYQYATALASPLFSTDFQAFEYPPGQGNFESPKKRWAGEGSSIQAIFSEFTLSLKRYGTLTVVVWLTLIVNSIWLTCRLINFDSSCVIFYDCNGYWCHKSCLSMLNRWLSAKWNKAEVSEASGIESRNVLNEAKKFLVSSGSEVENILKRKAENFVMRSQENTNSVAVSFWDGLENEFLVKKQIMSLSLDEEAFLRAPPIGTEFSFDFDSYVSQAEAALKADPNLENIRFRLVPRKIKEEDFWRNYFYRVHLVRSNAAAAAELATPVEAAEDAKTEEKKSEETADIEEELEDEDLSVDEKGRPVLDSCDFDLLGDAWEEEIQRICQFSNMTMRFNRFSHVVMKVVVIVVVVVVVVVAVAVSNTNTGKVEQPSSPSNKQAAVLLVVICDVFTQLKSIRIVLTLAMTTVKTTNSYYYEETSQSSPVRPPRRSKNVTHKQMNQILDEVKSEQEKNVVIDTLAALVTDVNATAQVLRRSVSRTRLEEYDRETPLLDVSRSDSTFERPPSTVWDRRGPEVEYHLLIHSPAHMDYTDSRYSPAGSRKHAWDQDSQKSGAPFTSMESLSRARSETPSRKIIVLENDEQYLREPVKSASPVCAACKQPILGPCITALAPNSTKAQKYHPSHFVCSYCMKPLNLKGTYREHERKPYCHECFYRLYTNTVQIKSLQLVTIELSFPMWIIVKICFSLFRRTYKTLLQCISESRPQSYIRDFHFFTLEHKNFHNDKHYK